MVYVVDSDEVRTSQVVKLQIGVATAIWRSSPWLLGYLYSLAVAFSKDLRMLIPKAMGGYKFVVACGGSGSYFITSCDIGIPAIFLQTPCSTLS